MNIYSNFVHMNWFFVNIYNFFRAHELVFVNIYNFFVHVNWVSCM